MQTDYAQHIAGHVRIKQKFADGVSMWPEWPRGRRFYLPRGASADAVSSSPNMNIERAAEKQKTKKTRKSSGRLIRLDKQNASSRRAAALLGESERATTKAPGSLSFLLSKKYLVYSTMCCMI